MKPPEKSRFKKWVMAFIATLGIGGMVGGGMMTTGIHFGPVDNNSATQYTSITSQFNFVSAGNYAGMSADQQLVAAAKLADMGGVRTAVSDGADVNVDNGLALNVAVSNNDLQMVQYLIDRGANVHASGEAALRSAASSGFTEIVKSLARAGADIHVDQEAALRDAARFGHFDTVSFLTEQPGTDVQAVRNFALFYSALNGHESVVKHLLQKGATASDEMIGDLQVNNADAGIVKILQASMSKAPDAPPPSQGPAAPGT